MSDVVIMAPSENDVALIAAAVAGVPADRYNRTNEHALLDFDLPALVRGFIAINQGPATETMAIRGAGFMPRLYGTYEGERVRVTMVSRLGDIGISREDKEHGYFERCSIYDLTDFSDEMHPGAPSKRSTLRYYTIVDDKGRWLDEAPILGGGKVAWKVVSEPRLFVEQSSASALRRKWDPHGLLGFQTVPIRLSKESE